MTLNNIRHIIKLQLKFNFYIMNNLKFTIILTFVICNSSYAELIKYYCPAPEDFKYINNQLIAQTNYNNVQYTWLGKDPNPITFPDSPITFKGATLNNCHNNICNLVCVYYANVENHVIEASSNYKNNQYIFTIKESLNAYLKNFQCQFTEHTDCPFLVEVK